MINSESHNVNPTDFTHENCLNTAQAAYALQIATGNLQNWRGLGIEPKFIKHRRKIYYLRTDIEQYIRDNFGCFGSTSEYKELEGK